MNWSRDPPTRPIRLHSEGRQHLKLLPALSAPHMGWSLCSRLAWYHGSLKGIHPQRVGSGKLSKSQGDRETGNEEQHISPLILWEGKQMELGLSAGHWACWNSRVRNAEGMWSNLPVAGQGGLLWSGEPGPEAWA